MAIHEKKRLPTKCIFIPILNFSYKLVVFIIVTRITTEHMLIHWYEIQYLTCVIPEE